MEKIRWLITSSVSLAIAIVLLLIFSGGAQALMLKMSLDELTAGADSVVVGTVVSSTGNWNADHTNIYTEVVVSVTDVLKGAAGENTVTVVVPGGTVGDKWQWVEDTPVFKAGENVGLFLKDLNSAGLAPMGLGGMSQLTAAGTLATVYGGSQGKLSFTGDNSGSLSRISPDVFKQNVNLALVNPLAPQEEVAPALTEVTSNQVISGINPNIASAGTNTLVTVTGSGFGTQGANDHLVFYYVTTNGTDYYMYIDSQIVSWSDTQIQAYVPMGIINGYPYSAASGPVAVYKNGDWSSPIPLTVTFGYGQYNWAGTGPTVTYRINDGGVAGRSAAIQAGANTWVNASANFSFSYGGTTSATTRSQNGMNEILWETLPAGMLGQASAWGSGSHLTEADFSFNTLYVWNTAPTCPAGQYDVQFISTHELGHWLSLRDLYGNKAGYPQDTAKVMYGVGNAGETKRALHPHDILGIQYIYGTLPTAAQKLVGADDAATTTPVGGGYLVLDKFTAVAPGNVSQIRVKCTTSGNVKVALYADSAGNPGALLGVNNGGTDVVAGWNNIYLPSTPVIMGTNYWIAYISTTNCVGYFSSPGGGAVFRALSYSSDFPASAGTGFTTSAGNHSLIAGWGIAGAIPLAVTTTSLPDGTTGVAYSQTLQAIGGTGSYTWSLTSGSLPPDLTLTGSTGVIAGNPTTVGTYSFTAQVNDGSTTASQPLSITIAVPTQKLLGADDAAAIGAPANNYLILDKWAAVATGDVTRIRVKCTTTGNVKVALYTDNSGIPGTLISANNAGAAVVAGWNNITIPSTAVTTGTNYWIAYISTTNCVGYFSSPGGGAVFRALSYSTDFPASAGTGFTTSSGNHSLTAGWGISGPTPLTITTTSLLDGTVGVAYSQTLQAIGGTGSYTWSLSSGSLPDGLPPISSGGLISGTPTTVSTYSFTVQVNDGSTTATKPLSITITNYQKLLGADDAAAAGPVGNNFLVLDRWPAVLTANVTQIRVKCTTTGNVKVALYTDNSGSPGTLINANNTGAAVITGWNNITIPSTAVISGTNYWIAYNSTTNCVGYYSSPGGGAVFRALSYSTDFPALAGAGFTTSSGNHSLTAGWGQYTPPAPPSPPSLLSPGTAITFRWGTSSGATTYWLQVNTAADFTGTNMFNAEVGNITTQEVTGLSLGTTYFWRVKAGNSSGWSAWTGVRSVVSSTVP